jgi:hypothetical protein
MNEEDEKVRRLIDKLNTILGVDGLEPSVSPALSESGGDKTPSDAIFIDESLNIDKLSLDQLLLVHVLLHRFYGSGSKNLSKPTIEKLHGKVSKKLDHQYFDKLDDK